MKGEKTLDRLDNAIKDVNFVLESLLVLRDIYSTGDCNRCSNKNCGYLPEPGNLVRYNCPFYISDKEETKVETAEKVNQGSEGTA